MTEPFKYQNAATDKMVREILDVADEILDGIAAQLSSGHIAQVPDIDGMGEKIRNLEGRYNAHAAIATSNAT